jgi:hypothetical protein
LRDGKEVIFLTGLQGGKIGGNIMALVKVKNMTTVAIVVMLLLGFIPMAIVLLISSRRRKK